jgi:cytochrome c-type protein NapB
MNKPVTVLLAALTLMISSSAGAQDVRSSVQTLRGADAATPDQAPPARSQTTKGPGGQKRVTRTFSTQPPVIPHTIEGFDQVTLQSNPCLSCHGPENYKNVKAPRPTDSHFRDRDGKMLPAVSAARYQCTACHVPQDDAKPLVGNTFRGDAATRKR